MYIGYLCFLFCEMPFVHVLTGYLFKLNVIYIYLFLLIYMSFKHFLLIFVLYFPLWFFKNELKFLISSAQNYRSFILYVVLKKKKKNFASWGHKSSILHFCLIQGVAFYLYEIYLVQHEVGIQLHMVILANV